MKITDQDPSETLGPRLDASMHSSNRLKEVLNIKEAAVFLGIALGTLYKLTSQRRIPFAKVGKRCLFRRTDLLEWLSNQSKLNYRTDGETI